MRLIPFPIELTRPPQESPQGDPAPVVSPWSGEGQFVRRKPGEVVHVSHGTVWETMYLRNGVWVDEGGFTLGNGSAHTAEQANEHGVAPAGLGVASVEYW